MKLITVKSATATANAGFTDFDLTVTDADDGSGEQYDLPFTLSSDDAADMSGQVSAWMAANPNFTVGPYVPPIVYPDLLPYQFRAMLSISGNTDKLNTFISALPSPGKEIAQAKLDYSLVFERDNALVLQAQQALGLTDDQLNTLWTQAAAIT